MALTTFVLHHWLPFPPVIDNDCVGDCRLCVFPLDVEVVGEGAAIYLFGQAVVAGGEVKQADMGIDGGGVVGGYGAQDGSEAEMLGKGDLQLVAVSLALDGVLLSVVRIVVVRVDDPRLHNGVGLREAFVGNKHTQGVLNGHGLNAVRRLFRICHRLPCR